MLPFMLLQALPPSLMIFSRQLSTNCNTSAFPRVNLFKQLEVRNKEDIAYNEYVEALCPRIILVLAEACGTFLAR